MHHDSANTPCSSSVAERSCANEVRAYALCAMLGSFLHMFQRELVVHAFAWLMFVSACGRDASGRARESRH